MFSLDRVRQSLESAGQQHVLQFWPELCEQDRERFLQELSLLDLEGVGAHCEASARAAASPPASIADHIEPVPTESIGSVRKSDKKFLCDWETLGEY